MCANCGMSQCHCSQTKEPVKGDKSVRTTLKALDTPEHTKIVSRTRGVKLEIGVGPHGDNLVSNNPFASLAQEGFLHAHPEKLGKKGLAEWDAATKGKSLPERAKK